MGVPVECAGFVLGGRTCVAARRTAHGLAEHPAVRGGGTQIPTGWRPSKHVGYAVLDRVKDAALALAPLRGSLRSSLTSACARRCNRVWRGARDGRRESRSPRGRLGARDSDPRIRTPQRKIARQRSGALASAFAPVARPELRRRSGAHAAACRRHRGAPGRGGEPPWAPTDSRTEADLPSLDGREAPLHRLLRQALGVRVIHATRHAAAWVRPRQAPPTSPTSPQRRPGERRAEGSGDGPAAVHALPTQSADGRPFDAPALRRRGTRCAVLLAPLRGPAAARATATRQRTAGTSTRRPGSCVPPAGGIRNIPFVDP
jgi:hypothetical protein